ncbi:MAG: TatD family hydrolase, partial [Chloroflexi bacterium]|nr:TatD family hydrolase [Chloroflexota bacterium]
MLTDCHTHLDQYPPGELSGVLHRARDAGVGFIIAAGTTLASSEACVRLSTQEPLLWSGVGIHPMDVTAPLGDATCERLHTLATSSPRVVTISEVGLDFSEHAPDLALQYQAFRQQIRLARELGLPIIVHSRELPEHPEGHSEVLRVLREERGWEVGGAMHYF